MDPLSYEGLENPYGMVERVRLWEKILLNYDKVVEMDQEELTAKLGLTKVQFNLFKSVVVNALFTYAQQIYDFEDEELPHDKEDVNAILELFDYRVEFGEDGVMYDLAHGSDHNGH